MRYAGLAVGLLAIGWALLRRRRGASRGEWLGWALVGFGIGLVSVVPETTYPLRDVFSVRSSLTAVLMLMVILLTFAAVTERSRRRELQSRFGDLVRNLALREMGVSPQGNDAPTVAVVIAAFNEQDAIEGVLGRLPDSLVGHRVERIVVVDGGQDDTEGVVKRAGYLVATHPVNRGQGDALRTGFAVALERNADIVMTMDADGQHDPADMPSLVEPIVTNEADYVQGSRYLGSYDDAGGPRDVGIRLFTVLVNALSNAHITDCTNGYRAIRAEGLARMRLEEDRFSAPEIIIEASRQGLRIREVPVHIRSRSHGESKKPRRLGYPIGFFRAALRTWLR